MLQRKKPKKRKFLVIFSVLTLILVLTCCVYAIASVMTDKKANLIANEANAYFASFAEKQTAGTSLQKIENSNDQPFTFALQYPSTDNQFVNTYITDAIEERKNIFISHYEKLRNKSNAHKKSEQYALFLSYTSNLTEDHILSVAFHDLYQEYKSDTTYAYWTPRMFDLQSGKELTASDIFRDKSYRQIASAYLISYFQNQSTLTEHLYTNYETTLAPESPIYDRFTLTEDAVVFYMNQYKILPQSYGAISVAIPREEFSGHFLSDPQSPPAVCDDTIQNHPRGIDPNKKMVALTFDDGPSPTATNRILDVLEKYGVVATFYDVGYRVAQHPEVVKREAASGSDVASHSYDHKDFAKMTAAQIQEDVEKTAQAFALAGVTPSSFRPPYGSTNATVEKNISMPIVTWSIDTLDWKSRNTNAILNQVNAAGNLDGKVLLFHGIYDSTAAAIETLVPQLIADGYQLVTVTEMITYRHNETPENGKLYGYSYFQ